jgi:hypothetical protein
VGTWDHHWWKFYDCGHKCCNQRSNGNHRHQIHPDQCDYCQDDLLRVIRDRRIELDRQDRQNGLVSPSGNWPKRL